MDTNDREALRKIDNETPAERNAEYKLTLFGKMQRDGSPGELMSYDPQTQQGAMMHLQATLGEVPDLQSLVNQKILVSNFLVHDASSLNEKGKLEEWKRIVIFDAEGQPYSCGSTGVGKSLAVMFPIWGMMPWIPPVECVVKVRRTGNKNIWMTLEPTPEEIAKLSKAKK